jgi:hypothetical protein
VVGELHRAGGIGAFVDFAAGASAAEQQQTQDNDTLCAEHKRYPDPVAWPGVYP